MHRICLKGSISLLPIFWNSLQTFGALRCCRVFVGSSLVALLLEGKSCDLPVSDVLYIIFFCLFVWLFCLILCLIESPETDAVMEMGSAEPLDSEVLYDCVICGQSGPSTEDRPTGLVVLLQASSGITHLVSNVSVSISAVANISVL